jgi:DNA-binding response OmpR family regulator
MTPDPPRPRLDARRTNERPHVLVVSDDLSLSDFLQEGLPLGGFWVSVIAGGLQALEVFRLRQFDLIALDAGLQSFDAVEFLRRLRGVSSRDRSATERSRAPVIVIHPTPHPEPGFNANELDVAAQLVPPIDLEDIVVTLHTVFAGWRSDHPDSPLADAASARAF